MQNLAKKKVIISVISDLVTDQRVNRAALTLHESGYEVVLVGRKLKKSLAVGERPYRVKRFSLWFEKGALFYACYNFRLFFYLLLSKADILVSNDLDTLLANYSVSKLKNIKLVYDSHEYFTEVPELVSRPLVRSVWLNIERRIFPMLKHVYTVNNSIASVYTNKYKVDVKVVRNLPFRIQAGINPVSRRDFGIPEDAKVFLFQGAGINIDRGAEESIESIANVPGAVLLFIGGGDVIDQLKQKVVEKNLTGKVFFIPRQPLNELIKFTMMADFGLTLDKDTNLNYRFSLPNKLFDYIQAKLPVLATDLPEIRRVIEKYDIGMLTASCEPPILAEKMRKMVADKDHFVQWKKNLNIAAEELCWENEKRKFLEIFKEVESA
jgi:glycosyltransferase involved in cell wall biosynthesis